MATTLTYYSGSSCPDTKFVRVGHNSGTLREDAVWRVSVGDSSMASINSVRVYYSWDNPDAGEGWSGGYIYVCKIYGPSNTTLVGAVTVTLSGSTGSGYVDIGGLSLPPNTDFYVHWNCNTNTYSTGKGFRKESGQSIDILTYTLANTAPYWSNGWCNTSVSGIIPENTSSITVTWGGAHDAQGDNTCRYYVYRRSSLGDVLLARDTYSTSLVDTIGAGNEGATYRYEIMLNDSQLWAANSISSSTVTKNTLTGCALNHSGSIHLSTPTIQMSHTTPSNTNGNTTFYYKLTCDKVTVYPVMADFSTTGNVLTIWRTGDAVPSTPYVKFDDLKTAFAGSSYAGNLTFTLSVLNAYGSSDNDTEVVAVDLRVTPTWPSAGFVYSGGYTINGTLRYLPDVRAITLAWDAATDCLGTAITYDVYRKLPSEALWTQTNAGLTSTTVDLTPPSGDVQIRYNIKVIAKSAYGYANTSTAPDILVDKYLRPLFGLVNKNRTTSEVNVWLAATPRTSLPAEDYSISALSYTKLAGTTVDLTPTTDWTPNFAYSEAEFVETSSYTMVCKFNDSIGVTIGGAYATALSLNVTVSAYIPMFSIRRLGVGINAINDAVGGYILKIKGKVNSVTDDLGASGFYENGSKCVTEANVANSICKVTSGHVGHTATASTWKTFTASFGVTYTSNPLISIIPTTPFSCENVRITGISTTGITFQIYESTVGFYFEVYWAAVGNISM